MELFLDFGASRLLSLERSMYYRSIRWSKWSLLTDDPTATEELQRHIDKVIANAHSKRLEDTRMLAGRI